VLLALGAGVLLAAWRFAFAKQAPVDYELVQMPVIQRPTALPADAVTLPDDTVVIGVEAGGRRRAYVLRALYPPERHVINDVLGGKPITVTYCDVTDCLAVFTDPDADAPLEIATGGWQGKLVRGKFTGSMLLRVGSFLFRQDTGQPLANHGDKLLPYTRAEFVRTTWKAWRDARPDTDVYVGDISSERAELAVEGATTGPAG
jgi:hypothetical protein